MSVENISILVKQFSNYIQHDCRGAEIFTYGIACTGLLTAFYKVRPFSRFTKPNDVPKHFFTKKVLLEGTVKNVEFDGVSYLLVDHKPLIPLPRLNSNYLPVKIAGVNVTSNGINWLQTIIKGQKITFIPISTDSKFLTCIVNVLENNKEPLSAGKELVKIGFGTVEELPSSSAADKNVKVYVKSLKLAQKWAERQRNGIWQKKNPLTLTWKLRNILEQKLRARLPVILVKYFNI
ncbi:PREDICTED: uncharacterized protein LOC105362883 [Ceratosolen solmsi marchali]|uniref:Uncharacterized protein LOC105362883 n=1 Tax=Ceratosolen solmsi marchali TaxID=326594 RepID=A0AAJ6YIM0_9HYME|nr:PREDICTED: uncharacterized protein LOC105362883 [Ceratosolen solmsi marchali]